ncbi:MAG: fumarylacetoacetase, partial [Phycisphaerales bacterium]|nr:fumarylacetoacetase [Phycisphaerales bacterium]
MSNDSRPSPAANLQIDATHDPELKSFVESANDPASDFPIQNLPLVAFQMSHDGHSHRHLGVLIGDQVLDVSSLVEARVFGEDDVAKVCSMNVWNGLAANPHLWRPLRERVQAFLRADAPGGQQMRRLRQKAMLPQKSTRLLAPMAIFNYTDFYASKFHAPNVGAMFRPDNPLLPNYTHVPIGYHGRASSIVVSGSEIVRPHGQLSPEQEGGRPGFGPCKMLDYEMEIGAYVGRGNELGVPVKMDAVREQLFGVCILNDWSARDMQKWEYQPLGPFLAKNFATSVSAGVVTMSALEPFRVEGPRRDAGDPEPLDYLKSGEGWGYDIQVEVSIRTTAMWERGEPAAVVSRGRMSDLYWTVAQMLVHHASNGCNLQPGDLLGSGTISGPEKGSRGCLLELTWDGVDEVGGAKKPKPRTPV